MPGHLRFRVGRGRGEGGASRGGEVLESAEVGREGGGGDMNYLTSIQYQSNMRDTGSSMSLLRCVV